MAIQRLTGAQIETAVLQYRGYSASTEAPWTSTANFMLRLNSYIQRLSSRVTALARELGKIGPDEQIRPDMWKTQSAASGADTATGIQTYAAYPSWIYLPVDFDCWIALYDATSDKHVPLVEGVWRYHTTRLKDATAGTMKAVELLGFEADSSSRWRRKAQLYPAQSGVPTLLLEYYRLPAAIDSAGAACPDMDPKYEQGVIAGVAAELLRPTGAEYERYMQVEKEMLLDMMANAKVI